MQPLFFCRCRLVKTAISFLTLLFIATVQGTLRPVFAQEAGAPLDAQQAETWNKSLRRAALQLAAASLSDGSGSGNIAPPLRLPQKIALLPLFVEKTSGRNALPIAEPALRTRLADYLIAPRYGDIAIFAPLSSRDTARIARLTPSGVGKNAKLDKTLDAARKSGADYVLYGTLTPSPGKVWLLNLTLVSVNRGDSSDAPIVVKAAVSGTLRFTDADRQVRFTTP